MIWRIYVQDWNETPGTNEKGGTRKPHRPPVWRRVRVVYVETCGAYHNVSYFYAQLHERANPCVRFRLQIGDWRPRQ